MGKRLDDAGRTCRTGGGIGGGESGGGRTEAGRDTTKEGQPDWLQP